MSAVPAATLRATRPGAAGTVARDPDVDHDDLRANLSAEALITAPPARKLPTIWVVTSCGHGDTPCAQTPWSPANTAMATGSGSGGGHSPYIPHRRVPRSSRAPRDPRAS